MGNFVQGDDDSDNSHSYGIEDSDGSRDSQDSGAEIDEDDYGHRESGDYSEFGE
jgi:hypothetical protein